MKKSANLYFTITTIVGLLIAMVISSVAWFSANDFLSTNTVTLTSSKSLQMLLSIPSSQSNMDSYMGQTGIEYDGLDSPYCTVYNPVELMIDLGDEKNYYMVCEIIDVRIKSVFEEEPSKILTTQQILSNFTWRFGIMQWQSVFNPSTGQYENRYVEKFYKNNNGFLYDEETGQPFRVHDGMQYNLTYYLYFLGEEGFSLMQATQGNINSRYTFAYSDLSYMWSSFYISINIGVRELYNVHFDSMGGSECSSIPTTGGSSILLPTPTTTDNTKYFGGWYDNTNFTGEPFHADTLKNNPRKGDFTLYAKWIDKFALSFNTNGCASSAPPTQYLLPGEIPTNPGVYGDIVAWTAEPMEYEDYLANPVSFDFNAPINQNTTVYAVRLKHLITLNMNTNYGGYLVVDGVTYDDTYTFYVHHGATIPNIYTPVPNITLGREFKKWSTNGSASSHITASTYNFSTPVTSEVQLYAYYGLG